MKIINCTQGSSEWFKARCGIPTASRFGDIVTPTGKPTKNASRETYRNNLVVERLTGEASGAPVTPAMLRGQELEPRARAWYELVRCVSVKQVGFCLSDDGVCGSSPDGLIGDDGGMEIKCPMPHNAISMLIDDSPNEDYLLQVQGNLWITGRKWWDLIVYVPEPTISKRIWRITPDSKIHAALAEHIPVFAKEVEAATNKMKELE